MYRVARLHLFALCILYKLRVLLSRLNSAWSMGPACSHGTTKDAPTQATRKAWMSICRKEDLDLELMAFKGPKDSPRVIPSHWRLICRKRQMMCMAFSIWCPGWYSCLAEIGGGVLDINPSKTPRDGNPNIGTSTNSI